MDNFVNYKSKRFWIGITLIAISFIGCVILLVRGVALQRQKKAEEASLQAAEAAKTIKLIAYSVDRDMHVSVRSSDGSVIKGTSFTIYLKSSQGDEQIYFTDNKGECYIVELNEDTYAVSASTEGVKLEEPISCGVYVNTSKVDKTEDKWYKWFNFRVGEHGHLLYSNSHEESDVIPIDNNLDGLPDLGLRYIPKNELTPDLAYYEKVDLYSSDGSPNTIFDVDTSEATVMYYGSDWQWRNENGKIYYVDKNGKRVTGLNKIDGKLYYFTENGEKARALGVDISCYNSFVDWKSVKDQGIDFVILRLGGRGWGSGAIYRDMKFLEYIRDAKTYGINLGVYFYSTAVTTSEAVNEARYIYKNLEGTVLQLPIFIDMEYSGNYPNGRADKLSNYERTEIVNAFCDEIKNLGYDAGIYSSQYYFENAINMFSVNPHRIWIANYTQGNKLPNYSGRYDIWQFTESGRIDGILGSVDINVIL